MKPLRWFNLWDFERDPRFYERLGVRHFKRFATQGDFWNKRRRQADPSFRHVASVDSAIAWESRTRFNEAVHLCSLALGLSIMAWLYSRGELLWLAIVFLAVLIWDVYPIMLQRYNRARIGRIRSLRLAGQVRASRF